MKITDSSIEVTFIAKSSAVASDSSNACSSISPRLRQSKHENSPRKPRHLSEIKADTKSARISAGAKNNNTEIFKAQAEDTALYGDEFKALHDGSFYYNPKIANEFMLGCTPKEEDGTRSKTTKRVRENATRVRASSNERPAEVGTKGFKAVGKSLTMTERKGNRISRRIVAARKFEQPCKRFCEKWQKMTAILLENNRAMKVQNRVEPSPAEECSVEEEDNKEQCVKTLYTSYLRDRYRSLLDKKCLKSEYALDNSSKTELSAGGEGKVEVVRVWKGHRRYDVNATSGIFKSPKEIVDRLNELHQEGLNREKLKRIKKNNEKSDIIIGDLRTKYGILYDRVETLKDSRKRAVKRISKLRKAIADTQTNVANPEPKISPTIYLTETVIDEIPKPASKLHPGNEQFPEFLQFKFASRIAPDQRACIEALLRSRWTHSCKMKISKSVDESIYYVVMYGRNCPLSNCCDSLVVTKVGEEGCWVCCMNKLCITKMLECFPLPAADAQTLFHPLTKNERKEDWDCKTSVSRYGRSNRNTLRDSHRATKRNVVENEVPDSSVFNTNKGTEVGLLIEKKQRVPLVKPRYLSLIVK